MCAGEGISLRAVEIENEAMDLFMTTKSSGRTLAILGFYKIGESSPGGWKSWFYILEETFVGYLRYRHEDGWQVTNVTTFLGGLKVVESLPERAAVLTFDDGYRSSRLAMGPDTDLRTALGQR